MSTINTHVRCVLFISGLICYFCVNCEIINRNCSSYGEVLKQDSKNCVDYTDEDFTEGFEENETESSSELTILIIKFTGLFLGLFFLTANNNLP